jgi:hypothetical protein
MCYDCMMETLRLTETWFLHVLFNVTIEKETVVFQCFQNKRISKINITYEKERGKCHTPPSTRFLSSPS